MVLGSAILSMRKMVGSVDGIWLVVLMMGNSSDKVSPNWRQ